MEKHTPGIVDPESLHFAVTPVFENMDAQTVNTDSFWVQEPDIKNELPKPPDPATSSLLARLKAKIFKGKTEDRSTYPLW